MTIKICNKLVDANNKPITKNELIQDSKVGKSINVVYAHAGVVNDNGLKLNEDSIETSRDNYPLLVEHSASRVEDIVGYIKTDGKPNDKGEFVGAMTFYDTPQGQHAKRLWEDGVFDELSVSYYIKDFEVIDNLDETTYINVLSAILKEVSIVSVGADRDTHEIEQEQDTSEDETEEHGDDQQSSDEPKPEEPEENSMVDEIDEIKLKYFKSLVD